MGRHASTTRVADGITVPPSANRTEVRIKSLRAKFPVAPQQRPAAVAESDWGIFTACIHEKRPLMVVSRNLGVPPATLRDSLARVESLMEPPTAHAAVTPDRPLEDLRLSVRARNALHRLGCRTVEDVFKLDFSASLRQLGSKTRLEILQQLEECGFRPAAPDKPSQTEMTRIAISLDRVQSRVSTAFESVIREIRALQDRLDKLR